MREDRLFLDVSASLSRVLTNLSSMPMQMAFHLIPENRSADGFRDDAIRHAEMLEREAATIRKAITQYHEARRNA